MPDNPHCTAGPHDIRLEGDLKGFDALLSSSELRPGLHVVTLVLTHDTPALPPEVAFVFSHPAIGVQNRWVPMTRAMPGLLPEWDCAFTSQMTRKAPVVCFYDLNGKNRLTIACSEAVLPVEMRAGIHEETASLRCSARLFAKPRSPVDRYEVSLLIDTCDVPYHEALRHVTRWWDEYAGYSPFPVPDGARVPFYSTWYSFHQSLVVDDVVEECRRARELGCEAVIVDDGWQTTDTGRGYPHTGDWEPVRIGDMQGFVDAIHGLGMKFLLWYSLPFAGKESRACQRFEGKTLTYIDGAGTFVLDPRYPEVRDYLLDVFETAMREWKLDGFKLDFVDWLDPSKGGDAGDGADFACVTDAAQTLLTDLTQRLRAINPDVIIEFRQPYIGPAMRRYANMFRAVDCPNDAHTNRVNTIDLRLLSGGTAIHSDMFMWHPDDTPACAALQLLNVLFAVPQVSVRIGQLSDDHRAMLRFWLGFWREHRDVLLGGELQPMHPLFYRLVVAANDAKLVMAFYGDVVGRIEADSPDELLLVNATRSDRVVLECATDVTGRLRVFDCLGNVVTDDTHTLSAGLNSVAVPAGLVRLTHR